MHGAWGSLTILLKRQNAEKYRKAQLRYDLQKKKEGFLHHEGTGSELHFPEVSEFEMEKIKAGIRSKLRKERIKIRFISFCILIAVIAFLVWFINAKTGAVTEFLR